MSCCFYHSNCLSCCPPTTAVALTTQVVSQGLSRKLPRHPGVLWLLSELSPTFPTSHIYPFSIRTPTHLFPTAIFTPLISKLLLIHTIYDLPYLPLNSLNSHTPFPTFHIYPFHIGTPTHLFPPFIFTPFILELLHTFYHLPYLPFSSWNSYTPFTTCPFHLGTPTHQSHLPYFHPFSRNSSHLSPHAIF